MTIQQFFFNNLLRIFRSGRDSGILIVAEVGKGFVLSVEEHLLVSIDTIGVGWIDSTKGV